MVKCSECGIKCSNDSIAGLKHNTCLRNGVWGAIDDAVLAQHVDGKCSYCGQAHPEYPPASYAGINLIPCPNVPRGHFALLAGNQDSASHQAAAMAQQAAAMAQQATLTKSNWIGFEQAAFENKPAQQAAMTQQQAAFKNQVVESASISVLKKHISELESSVRVRDERIKELEAKLAPFEPKPQADGSTLHQYSHNELMHRWHRWNQRANKLSDECGALKSENTELLAENARLRRGR